MAKKLRRILQVILVLTRMMIVPYLLARRQTPLGPIRMRQALEYLGGTWIKLGQALALRFDLLPSEYCYELFKLLNEVKPFSYGEVCQIIREDLGAYPEEIFSTFENTPFAAASIGQVHRARLKTGERVAVKVQRPHIKQIFEIDFELMFIITSILDTIHFLGISNSRRFITEFARMTIKELDYENEARNAIKLIENSRNDPFERNALVFLDYTTSRVLTAELLQGIPLIDIMYALGRDDTTYLRDLESQGYDLFKIVRNLEWNTLNQLYVFGFFHADLHPANIFILPENAIGYVDFGIVGDFTTELKDSLRQYTMHLFNDDFEDAVNDLLHFFTPSNRTNIDVVRQEMIRIHESFMFTLKHKSKQSMRRATSLFGIEILNVARRNAINISPSVVAYFKTLVTADTLRFQLAPDYDLRWIIQRFFKRMAWQQVHDLLDAGNIVRSAIDSTYRLQSLIRTLESKTQNAEIFENLVMNLEMRIDNVRSRLQFLSFMALVVGTALITVFARRDPNQAYPFALISTDAVLILLSSLFIYLIISIVISSRRL